MPQPGNVSTHVFTMSMAMLHLTAFLFLAAPTPMMAVVFVCVVETGRPPNVEMSRQTTAAKLAEKPWCFSRRRT